MDPKLIEIINQNFPENQRLHVIEILESVNLGHVMANSETNLLNTRLAILKLAKGDTKKLVQFAEAAKKDFRDVIFWASRS